MTPPRTFEESLADIRKRGAALPPDLEPARQAFVTDVLKSALAEDPVAALRAAIREAAAQIIAKAMADLQAGRPAPAQKGHPPMDATEYVTKGGPVWPRIEAGAAKLAGQTVGRMTRTQMATAVAAFLETAEGKTLYDEYTAEADRVAQHHARARLAPPDGKR